MIRWLGVAGLALSLGCSGDGGGDGGTEGSTGTTGEPDSADESSGEPPMCEAAVGSTPLQRLTPAQYANTVRDVLGYAVDVSALDLPEKVGPFDANFSAPVSTVLVEQYRGLAEQVAAEADVNALLSCDDEATCLEPFVQSFGRRLLRRPLTDSEQATYLELAAGEATPVAGARLVVEAMLQAPHFLYQLELGLPDDDADGLVALDGFELATRLSFFLWNSTPDDALLDAAAAGELETSEGLLGQAQRLLADGRARTAVGDFHAQWLGIDHLESTDKDPAVYPEYDEAMARAMRDETRRFTSTVVLQGDGRLQTLLTADYTYLEPPLFELYGITPPAEHHPGMPVSLAGTPRMGLLTQGAFLAAHAHPNQSGPIKRGVEVRTHLLCDPPPPPPVDAMVIPPDPDPDLTTRELFELHTEDPACAGCHSLIDGIGLGFEGFDGIGAYREQQNGMPVDQAGVLVGTDVDGEFEGVAELAERLASSDMVRQCVTRQWFRFAFGRNEAEQDACTLELLDETFAASGYDVRALMLELIQTDAFRLRAAE